MENTVSFQNNRNLIIGTAGHIDHGKTTLIKALTGHNTDTLEEEVRRGITINLGFTWFDLNSGIRAGIIDVPGHERFIKNMIAGATGVDMALMIVAANEGVKPQTVEHLDILSCLDISGGIIVMTKCGIADQLMIELVKEDIKETVKGTFLEKAEIVCVDSKSGEGIETLKEKIDSYAKQIRTKNVSAPARLNIDRVFTKKGFGTVVTGTLIEGKIRVNDGLTLYPQNVKVKIRSVQVHETGKDFALAGQRTALNLSGVKASDLRRGDVLAEEGTMEEANMLDVKIRLFDHALKPVKFWDRLRLYLGAKEVFCRVVPLSGDIINPGKEDFCQLRLEEAVYCKKDDRFVIRYYSPMDTIGGGAIIDPHPKKHAKMNDALLNALSIKETGGLEDVVEDYIKNNPEKYPDLKSIRAYAAADEAEISQVVEGLVKSGIIVKVNTFYFHMSLIDEIKDAIIQALSDYHGRNPLKRGMLKEELKSRFSGDIILKAKEFESLLKVMEQEKLLKISGNMLALKNFTLELSPEQQNIKQQLLKKLSDAGFSPPTAAELTSGSRNQAEVLELLAPDTAVFLDNQTVIHIDYYNKAKDLILGYLQENGEITLAQFRDLLGTSRKYAQLLIESFDNSRITIRLEDKRVLGRKC